jgi:hypothetical protein
MKRAQEELAALLDEARAAYEKIGAKLVEWEGDPEVGPGGVLSLKQWLHATRGITLATLTIWYRIAKGELPREIVNTQITHSVIPHLSTETAEELLSGKKYSIVSEVSQSRVAKPVQEFTRGECKDWVRPHGVLPINADREESFRKRYRATSASWVEEGNTLEVYVGSQKFWVLVPARFLERVEA